MKGERRLKYRSLINSWADLIKHVLEETADLTWLMIFLLQNGILVEHHLFCIYVNSKCKNKLLRKCFMEVWELFWQEKKRKRTKYPVIFNSGYNCTQNTDFIEVVCYMAAQNCHFQSLSLVTGHFRNWKNCIFFWGGGGRGGEGEVVWKKLKMSIQWGEKIACQGSVYFVS